MGCRAEIRTRACLTDSNSGLPYRTRACLTELGPALLNSGLPYWTRACLTRTRACLTRTRACLTELGPALQEHKHKTAWHQLSFSQKANKKRNLFKGTVQRDRSMTSLKVIPLWWSLKDKHSRGARSSRNRIFLIFQHCSNPTILWIVL
jgi:hypothetical protein